MNKSEVYSKSYEASTVIEKVLGVPAEQLAKYLTAIAYVESTFNPTATNKKSTARGLTQVLINTQRWIETKLKLAFPPAIYKASKYPEAPVTAWEDEDGLFKPSYALLIGAYYLAYQYKRYNDWHKAIMGYHLGSYKKNNNDGITYQNKVLKAYKELNLGEPLKKTKTKRVPVTIIVSNDKQYISRYYY